MMTVRLGSRVGVVPAPLGDLDVSTVPKLLWKLVVLRAVLMVLGPSSDRASIAIAASPGAWVVVVTHEVVRIQTRI